MHRPAPQGRASRLNPPNRFERRRLDDDFGQMEQDDEFFDELRHVATDYLPDDSRSIVSKNDSPDIPFRYSLNPYRGCQHGCSYCYARPTHEYLGLNAGLDFESKILVKHRAPELLRDWLNRKQWTPELIVFSGITDCYQPAERQFKLTRRCLAVALEACQPIGIITKNALVTRDTDLLKQMAAHRVVRVTFSITTLDESLGREMEPRTSTPSARLRAMRVLSDAGIPTSVMVAPIIPGLNDSECAEILAAAKQAGAEAASFALLRLPLTVRPVFLEWLERTQSARKDRVESRIRATRHGRLNDSKFGDRMVGDGELATQIAQMFRIFAKKYGLDKKPFPLDTSKFRPPRANSGQLTLF